MSGPQRGESGDPRKRHRELLDDPDFKAWAEQVRSGDLVGKLRQSAMVATFLSDGRDPSDADVKQALEIGMALLLDKPLVLMVGRNAVVPDHLRRAADEIIAVDMGDPAAVASAGAALQAFAESLDDEPS